MEPGEVMGSAEDEAAAIEREMTDDERLAMVISVMGPNSLAPVRDSRIPDDERALGAGYTPGVPRLGVPALRMSDASLGITNPGYRPDDTATALPCGLSLGSSFNPDLAGEAGRLLGREGRARGFNVVLAGGINLARDVRNGRNFEYVSEDPLVSALIAAGAIEGVQSEGVISTIKHFSLNFNETNRHWLDARIDPDAHRESDLLAFQIAIELARPGAVMTGYNKVNGEYAGGSAHLIRDVLKGAWAYPGWVMSDWGATPTWEFALAGLDQESGVQMDVVMWGAEAFAELRGALANGRLPRERLSDMVCRILCSIRAVGVDDARPAPEVDMVAHDMIALEGARQGIVLLVNDGILPVPGDTTMRILVMGMHANVGVPTGTGSSAVTPPGGFAATIRVGGPGVMGPSRNLYLLPSVPLEEIRKAFPHATVDFSPGMDAAESALAARNADLVIAFGLRPEGESFDLASLDLPWGQDAVIDAVADANPNTVVVLMTGNPSTMGWRHKARAVLQAWYPGQSGARAIAEVISGQVNPSGRLPMTFPTNPAQTPRPELPGLGTPWGTPTTIAYDEGSDVGYRWYARTGAQPMYAFGHGLSYTTFEHTDLSVTGGQTVTGTVTVTNTGDRPGADVVQVYLTQAAGERLLRLIALERVALDPGESRQVAFRADPRLLARFDGAAGRWRITGGPHQIAVGRSATDLVLRGHTELAARLFGA